MVRDAVCRPHQRRALGSLCRVHIEGPVATEESVVDAPRRHLRHLLCGGGIAADIDGDTVTEGNNIAHALRHIVVVVVAGLHRLHGGIAQIKGLMHPARQRLVLGDDPAVLTAEGDFRNLVVVWVVVGHQDQVGGQVVPCPGIGVDVDHLALGGDDADAALALVEKPRLRYLLQAQAVADQDGHVAPGEWGLSPLFRYLFQEAQTGPNLQVALGITAQVFSLRAVAPGADQHGHTLLQSHIAVRLKKGVADAVNQAQSGSGGDVGVSPMALRHIFKGFSFARRLLAVGTDQDGSHLCPGQRRLRVKGVGGDPRHNASLI